MKILVSGANGQLGHDVVKILSKEHIVFGYGKEQLDITNQDLCSDICLSVNPDVVIHCAAYTKVDSAESEEEAAFEINAFGTRKLVTAAENVGAKFCYISTDYVFDGKASNPYKEHCSSNPQNVYGKSKRAGELFVETLSSKYFVVRTSWLYGAYGSNFVKTMLRLAENQKVIRVVDDQRGSPTYTVDLAYFLHQLIKTELYGYYHASNTGVCSWFEFANAIFEESGIQATVEPCTTEDLQQPASRPRYSALDHHSIRENGLNDLRSWRLALSTFLKEIKELKNENS